MDVAHAEAVESGLDVLIEKRDKQRRKVEGERDEEALWMASVRRYEASRRTQTLWERLRYHEHMMRAHARTHEVIVGRHRLEVERCEAMLGIQDRGEGAS